MADKRGQMKRDKDWVAKLIKRMSKRNPLVWNLGIPIDSAIREVKEWRI